MKYSPAKIKFESFFRLMLLIFIAYFLFLLTLFVVQVKNNAEIGRYKFDPESYYVIDTKTGTVKRVQIQ